MNDAPTSRDIRMLANAVTNLSTEIRQLQKPRPQITNVYGENLHYDDQTLTKVHKALHDAYRGPDDPILVATELISAMQNAGILFRERKPS